MSVNHYENFPVGSWALPRRLRRPVHAVYAFARYADDLAKFKVTEEQIAAGRADFAFQRLMAYQCERAFKMLKAGSPLGRTLKGRIGLELRMIVVGGQMILQKLDACRYNVFDERPVLAKQDWWLIVKRAVMKK